MSILKNARAHFLRQVTEHKKCIEIPEWGDELGPGKVYYTDATTIAQMTEPMSLHDQGKRLDAAAETLLNRALNEDGSRMFPKMSRDQLRQEVDMRIVLRIVRQMNDNEEDESEIDLGN